MPGSQKQHGNHRLRWTLEELSWVEKHYHNMPTLEIAARLGRTVTAIRLAARTLGLSQTQTPWREEELAVLYTHYADGAGIAYVQTLLPGRAKKSITAKANGLGITSARNWHPDEVAILRAFYATMGGRVAEKLPRRSGEAVKIKAGQLGLIYHNSAPREGPGKRWTEEEWHVLENNRTLSYDDLMRLLPGRTKAALKKGRERLRTRRRQES